MDELTPPGGPTWESVLAAMEADVARAEELVRTAPPPAGPVWPVAADVMLPGGAPNLPDPGDLPGISRDLLGRMETLRTRMTVAQHALTDALADLGRQAGRAAAAARPAAPATVRFVDRIA